MAQKLEEEQKADEELKEKFVRRPALNINLLMHVRKLHLFQECWCKQNNDDKSAAISAAQTGTETFLYSCIDAAAEIVWHRGRRSQV